MEQWIEKAKAALEVAKAKLQENKETVVRIGLSVGGAVVGVIATTIYTIAKERATEARIDQMIADSEEDDELADDE